MHHAENENVPKDADDNTAMLARTIFDSLMAELDAGVQHMRAIYVKIPSASCNWWSLMGLTRDALRLS
jgi:hypothetical protein